MQVPQGIEVSIYKDLGGDGAYNYNQNRPLLVTVSSSQKVKLKTGIYDVVVSDPSNLYSNPVTKEIISYNTKTVTVHPSYNDQKLESLLPSVRPSILESLYKAYPHIPQNYTVINDHLYVLGDWYGSVLKPKNPSLDTLRIIMHKEGSAWKLAIKQPTISIGEPSNPTIPPDVIEKVDQL